MCALYHVLGIFCSSITMSRLEAKTRVCRDKIWCLCLVSLQQTFCIQSLNFEVKASFSTRFVYWKLVKDHGRCRCTYCCGVSWFVIRLWDFWSTFRHHARAGKIAAIYHCGKIWWNGLSYDIQIKAKRCRTRKPVAENKPGWWYLHCRSLWKDVLDIFPLHFIGYVSFIQKNNWTTVLANSDNLGVFLCQIKYFLSHFLRNLLLFVVISMSTHVFGSTKVPRRTSHSCALVQAAKIFVFSQGLAPSLLADIVSNIHRRGTILFRLYAFF